MMQHIEPKFYSPIVKGCNQDWIDHKFTELKANCSGSYVLLYLNIKNFRYYNALYGISGGDEILILLYQSLLNYLSEDEYIGHLFADHFAILMKYPGSNDLLLKRLDDAVEVIYRIDDKRIYRNLFTSIGTFVVEDSDCSLEQALNTANVCRREMLIPNSRCTSVEFYDEELYQNYISDHNLERNIAEAYFKDEFVMFLQPKVDLNTRRIAGAEVLMRWFDSEGNLVPVYKFLPVLNTNSYIQVVDLALFQNTCDMLDTRLKKNLPVVPISFNVSKSHFYQDTIVEDYLSILNKYQIPHHLITFELMESISLDDTERMKYIIQKFQDNGFSCSLDDFGNGYSSFNVLLNAKLDTIKMDRQFFLKNLNGDSKLIIKTIVNLIKSLDMKVVAEGVETKEYVDFLTECGCDMIQGYYFYKPMPMEEFTNLLDSSL